MKRYYALLTAALVASVCTSSVKAQDPKLKFMPTQQDLDKPFGKSDEVYDANQPKDKCKTWVISGPAKDAQLRSSGLMAPVIIKASANK